MPRRRVASGGLVLIRQAADQSGLHPQTIRMYEQAGLVEPRRSEGGTRMYGPQEIDRLRLIATMTTELGLNLAGVERVLELESQLEQTRSELDQERRRAKRREASLLHQIGDLKTALGRMMQLLGVLQLPRGR